MGFEKTNQSVQLENDIMDSIYFRSSQLNIEKYFSKDDIALLLCDRLPLRYTLSDAFVTKVGRRLLDLSDRDESRIIRYKVKGKVKRGLFTLGKTGMLKRKTRPRQVDYYEENDVEKIMLPEKKIVDALPSPDTYLGKAGEMAVSSELLYRGYNISLMAVDDGIDIVAIKHNNTYLIQVKTMTSKNDTTFATHIRRGSFERYRYSNCFYVFVLRSKEKNTFVVMSAIQIDSYMGQGVIQNNPNTINLTFRVANGNILLSGKENIDHLRDRFSLVR